MVQYPIEQISAVQQAFLLYKFRNGNFSEDRHIGFSIDIQGNFINLNKEGWQIITWIFC
jgi:hypothetical protein